jgi:hypothetical protein
MTNPFSARPQALGYLHQVRFSLLLILEREESRISIESLDDLVLEESGNSLELLQLKHHATQAMLTDSSPDLWKTLRVWSTHAINGNFTLPGTILSLITTSLASDDSAASYLKPGPSRNPQQAYQMLLGVAEKSDNAQLFPSFKAFIDLPEATRELLVHSIYVLDNSPDILHSRELINKALRSAVRREHRENLIERLEGWWFDKVVANLRGLVPSITGFEVYDKIREIAEQFNPDALPIDYYQAVPPEGVDPESDRRMFVEQLRAISVRNRRIEKAILDYYRAFEQRSRWVREELLVGDEITEYEYRLIDELERIRLDFEDEHKIHSLSEEKLQEIGRQLLRWVEQIADLRIRPNVSEPYVMRGSYHILADNPIPRVWWHPKFMERLALLISKARGIDA